MENKKAAILVLAIGAAVLIATGAAYATMGRQTSGVNGNTPYGYGTGPSMMGGPAGYAGGMMGGYSGNVGGMMGGYWMMGNGANMYQHMQQYMARYWNSTAIP